MKKQKLLNLIKTYYCFTIFRNNRIAKLFGKNKDD